MTELQIGLIAVGATLLIGVVLYNRFQLRGRGDGAVTDELGASEAAAGDAMPAADAGADMAAVATAAPVRPRVDPLIDCVVAVHLDAPQSAAAVLAAAESLRRATAKPVHLDGRRDEAEGGAWEPLGAGSRGAYTELEIAVQLANRSGALNAVEFSAFVSAVQHLAASLDGTIDAPDMNETIAHAQELDAFAAGCDVQLTLHLVSDSLPWSAAQVQALAAQDQLVLSRDGSRFARFADNAATLAPHELRPVFTLLFADTNFLRDDLTTKTGSRITLTLDLPQVPQALSPFRAMWDYAQQLAGKIGADVVDDNQRPVPEAALVAIERQLDGLYAQLDSRGLAAGSPLALRLFSL